MLVVVATHNVGEAATDEVCLGGQYLVAGPAAAVGSDIEGRSYMTVCLYENQGLLHRLFQLLLGLN